MTSVVSTRKKQKATGKPLCFASDYFSDMAKEALSLSFAFDRGEVSYPGYRSSRYMLSQAIERAAGIARPPYILDKKENENFLWMKHWLDGYKKQCTSASAISDSEKLRRYAVICLRVMNEPVADWCHFRADPISYARTFPKDSK